MVVLSVALCTKTGKSLFARQYVDMQRGRVEGLLAAFPKLVGSAGTSQHTYVETDAVRYVYHPVDKLYIVLVTNKQSNIMEDLDTLRLLAKLVPDICGSTGYDVVQSKVFDVLFAFDEVITSGGYKEDITLRQVRSNMEMNSHDERLAKLIRQSKINEAQETANAKAKALSEARKAGGVGYMDGFGRDSHSGYSGSSAGAGSSSSSHGRAGAGSSSTSRYAKSSTPAPAPASSTRRARRGMKLGSRGKKKEESALASLMQEEHIPSGTSAGAPVAVEESKGPAVDVEIAMTEKLNVAVMRDGSVKKMQVTGTMSLTCQNPEATRLRLAASLPEDSGFQFQPHPNVSKKEWKAGTLQLKDPTRSLPVNSHASLLRWRQLSRSDTDLPIALNVWPDSLDEGTMTVTVDYTLNRPELTLSDFVVRIPLPPGSEPVISQCDGQNNHVTREDVLEWTHVLVDSSSTEGTLEFEVQCDDESAFFPVTITFASKQCLCPLAVTAGERLDETGAPVGPASFRTTSSLVVSNYTISEE